MFTWNAGAFALKNFHPRSEKAMEISLQRAKCGGTFAPETSYGGFSQTPALKLTRNSPDEASPGGLARPLESIGQVLPEE